MSGNPSDICAALIAEVGPLFARLSSSKTTNVSSAEIRTGSQQAVQSYFRELRPTMVPVGISEADVSALDQAFQNLNRLAFGINRRASYIRELRTIRSALRDLSPRINLLMGQQVQRPSGSAALSVVQGAILSTLEQLVPSAALSFRQALLDLSDGQRVSFRGPASELREALRETIDHLAPDDAVRKAPGFQVEKGRTQPTMRQKVRFILRNRGKSDTMSDATIDSANRIEAGTDALARSLYNRGSLATHVAGARGEVINVQRYTEVLLAELLEIDKART